MGASGLPLVRLRRSTTTPGRRAAAPPLRDSAGGGVGRRRGYGGDEMDRRDRADHFTCRPHHVPAASFPAAPAAHGVLSCGRKPARASLRSSSIRPLLARHPRRDPIRHVEAPPRPRQGGTFWTRAGVAVDAAGARGRARPDAASRSGTAARHGRSLGTEDGGSSAAQPPPS
ncbi:hypothetical protein PAHAL_4G267100 [Panicum hallii]|uniref:Uncharacterized protein n=1 Tax=Panicum hallii TaxID=206008 RepID=A0A2T8JE20_9POAL|nr:hypothetical protein PAHAL_4G267100 [Panicum hallii]